MADGNGKEYPPKKIMGLAMVALIFGLLTIVSGGNVLFGDQETKTAAGNYVPFVLWFNFFAGFAYVLAGVGLFTHKKWAVKLSIGIAALTLLVFAGFGISILVGNSFEPRTVGAMVLRSGVWVAIAFTAQSAFSKTRGTV